MTTPDRLPELTVAGDAAPKSPRHTVIDLLALAVPAATWFVHLNVSYVLVPPSCRAGHRWFLLLATVIALACMVPSATHFRPARRRTEHHGVGRFLGELGRWLTLLFAMATTLVWASSLVVGPCG